LGFFYLPVLGPWSFEAEKLAYNVFGLENWLMGSQLFRFSEYILKQRPLIPILELENNPKTGENSIQAPTRSQNLLKF
jgi:hypothetical protein